METRDAPFPTTIVLKASHCQAGDRPKPGSCVIADAIKDTTGCTVDPVVGTHIIKIVKDGIEWRYSCPSPAATAIRTWDRDKKGKLGDSMWQALIAKRELVLRPPPPSDRKGARTRRKNSWKENPHSNGSGQRRHLGVKLHDITRRVRRAGSSYDPNVGVPVGQIGMTYAERVIALFKARKEYTAREIVKKLMTYNMSVSGIHKALSRLVKQGQLIRESHVYSRT